MTGGRVTLYLTEAEVEGLLTMKDALHEVEIALREMGEGRGENRPRQRVRTGRSLLSVMPAGLASRGYFGFKYYTVAASGARFWFHLFDAKTSDPVAILQADRLGQRRTGAASGVATKYLARDDADVIGIVGTGWQAESQLEAIVQVRPIQEIRCFGRDRGRRKEFADRMSARVGVRVHDAESAERAVRGADIVVTATGAREPVLMGEWLADGAHVNAMGSNRADAREVDDETVARAACIFCDSLDQAKIEAGDLLLPISRGIIGWDRVHELGELVAGRTKGRERAADVTLFKSLGIALEDVAVGSFVYERAREEGVGTEIPI